MATPRTAAQTGAAAPTFSALLAAARAPAYGCRMDTDPGFDTLAWAQRLKAAGVEDKQAEAHAAAARDSQAGPATKADLDNLEARLETKIERGVNRTLIAMIIVAGVIVAALVTSTVAIMNQLP